MNYRHMIGVGALAGLLLSGCSRDATPKAPAPRVDLQVQNVNPPNVILIVADQLGVMDTGLVEGGDIPTPNLQALAKDGANFTLAYAPSSAAAPARAGLITGTHPSRIGFEYDSGPGARDEREKLGLPLTEITLGTTLKGARYATGYFGRWGLGGMSVHYPTNRGYTEFYGVLASTSPAIRADVSGIVTVRSPEFPDVPGFDKYSRTYFGNDTDVAENTGLYAPTDFTDKALAFITKHAREPFFLTLALPTGAPLQVPARFHALFPGIKDPARRVYTAQIAALDENVGRVMALLAKTGVRENTLVIFTANTGCNPESGACNCAGLRGGAVTMYDGGTRAPLLIRWPEGIKRSSVYSRPVSLLDVYPTVLAATNATRPPGKKIDGVDLLPYARVVKAGEPHEALVWTRRPAVAIRRDNWKIISDPLNKTIELFDLAKDPLEKIDLSSVRTDMVTQMQNQVEIASTLSGDPLWRSRERATIDYCQKSTTIYR